MRKLPGRSLSGGVYGTLVLAMTYDLPFMATALTGGMQAVADMPQWSRLQILSSQGNGHIFDTWPRLAPQILEYTNVPRVAGWRDRRRVVRIERTSRRQGA